MGKSDKSSARKEIFAHGEIRVRGARQHNLQNLDLSIPRDRLVVVTGPSGSGKSSLAFNTLYAEGQRRYVESLSAYARQFLDQLEKPDVDFIEGLSPAIAIEQSGTAPNPRSTVATVTEIYDYLRILFAAAGQPHDPFTGTAITQKTRADIVEEILALPEETRVVVLAPLLGPKDEPRDLRPLFEHLQRQGYVRVRVNGEIHDLDGKEELKFNRKKSHTVEAVIDRLVVREDVETRLHESIEAALRQAGDTISILHQQRGDKDDDWTEVAFTTAWANPDTGYRLEALTPQHFSFNSHLGACPSCQGLGTELILDASLLVPDPTKSLAEGAVKTWWSRNKKLKHLHDNAIAALAQHYQIDLDKPFEKLPEEFKKALFYGAGDVAIATGWKTGANTKSVSKPFEGLIVQAERLYNETDSESTLKNLRRFMNAQPCAACDGKRLRPEMLAVRLPLNDETSLSITDFTALPVEKAVDAIAKVALPDMKSDVLEEVVGEIQRRVQFLANVGLGYLTLDRQSGTLSGGESQRIRLATQIGGGLAGVLYVLDEPSIGLHPEDNQRLIRTMERLRDLGNTVVVVEHDEEAMRAADWIVDLGPGAGPRGGKLIAEGSPAEIMANKSSITGQFLSGEAAITPPTRREVEETSESLFDDKEGEPPLGRITIHGAREHNLQNIDVSIPLGAFVCVTGMSGSGKSTLVDSILRRALFRRFYNSKDEPGAHDKITGLEYIDKAIVIDQSPIGRSPRSNPATFAGAFTAIRELFAQLPAAKVRGYTPGRFSFNVAGGRCEVCQGDGQLKIDMHFLSDAWVKCDACNGRRYNQETLDITFKGKSIADILEMTVDEAERFFVRVPQIHDKLRSMSTIGLGYLKLGQSATTISGGEAQRLKLATELAKKQTGNTLYLLDEPTTGLHFSDIDTLLKVFYRLRDAGNSLVVIEHNLDVIKCADWIIDLGPGGGEHGGKVVVTGPPEEIAKNDKSLTGTHLAHHLNAPVSK